MKRLRCWIKAIPLWLKTGLFVPHLYEATTEDAIIIATESSFRVADNYNHTPNETVYPHAILERCRCVRCGAEELSWCNSREYKEGLERC